MLRGDRGFVTTAIRVAIGLFALVCLGGLVWDISAEQAANRVEARDAAEYYRARTNDDIGRECGGLLGTALVDCIAKHVKSGREDQRAEYDLAAQRQAAHWTMIAGSAAALGFAVSLIGVCLVFITFRETRKATSAALDANRISRDQARAHLTITEVMIQPIAWDTNAFTLSASIRNSGDTVARNLTIRCESRWGDATTKTDYVDNISPEIPISDITAQSDTKSVEIIQVPERKVIPNWPPSKMCYIHIDIIVSGYDIFGDIIEGKVHAFNILGPSDDLSKFCALHITHEGRRPKHVTLNSRNGTQAA